MKRRLHGLFADVEWMGVLRKTVGFVFVGFVGCWVWYGQENFGYGMVLVFISRILGILGRLSRFLH